MGGHGGERRGRGAGGVRRRRRLVVEDHGGADISRRRPALLRRDGPRPAQGHSAAYVPRFLQSV